MQKGGMISVIMGVHNEKEEFLNLAVKSILDQTYRDFEFIIIDDYSEVNCEGHLKGIAAKDSRIKLLRNETNLGLTKSLNKALSFAEGEYIARMDADDFSTADRFEKQIAYFNQHPDIDLLGGGVVSFGDECKFFSPAFGYTNDEAQCELFFQSTLCHPSVMIKRDFLIKHNLKYDENVKKGQDYDMWERCSICGKLAVMSDVILYYRTHADQISFTNRSDQNISARMVRTRRLKRIGLNPTEEEYRCHLMLLGEKDTTITCEDVKAWMNKILQANNIYLIADPVRLYSNLKERFVLYKVRNRKLSICNVLTIINVIINRIKAHMKLSRYNKLINQVIQ